MEVQELSKTIKNNMDIRRDILNNLRYLIEQYPELRFGQLLVNIFRIDKYDPFYSSDETMLNDTVNYIKREVHNN